VPSIAILIDFGSTFTKVLAVDLDRAELLGRSQAPSTVDSDVREGLVEALKKLPVGRICDPSSPTTLTPALAITYV